jgi:hypothetical protein
LPPRCPALGVDHRTIDAVAEAHDDGGALATRVDRKITPAGAPSTLYAFYSLKVTRSRRWRVVYSALRNALT